MLNRLIKIFKNYFYSLLYCALFFVIFIIAEPHISELINKFLILPFFVSFKPSSYFDLILMVILGFLIRRNYKRKPSLFDFFVITVYIHYRFFASPWDFMPIFTNGLYGKSFLLYIDFIAAYYIILFVWNYLSEVNAFNRHSRYPDGFLYTDLSLEMQANKMNTTISKLDGEGLKRDKFASEIAYVITQMIPFRAFAIGICGPWGSGKTSLIDLIIANLKVVKKDKEYLYIAFSPWFFSNPEMLIKNFFSLLEVNFSANKFLTKELHAYGKQIAMAEKSLLSTEFSKLVFDEEPTLQERYKLIIEEIKNENKILIITIDDLDRLDKKEVVEVFRLIRMVADFPNTFYIVGYDRSYITAAIKQELTDHNADKYIDKIFNIEFKIPELTVEILKRRLEVSITSQLENLKTKIGKVDTDALKRCFDFEETVHIIRNERDIKRFTNNLLMRYISISQEISFYHFFLMELIYFKDNEAFNTIYENRKLILDRFEEIKQKRTQAVGINLPDLLKKDFDSLVIKIFDELFKISTDPERYALSNRFYFNRYFTLTLNSSDFTNYQFDKVFGESPPKFYEDLLDFKSASPSLLKEKLLMKANLLDYLDSIATKKLLDACIFIYSDIFFARQSELAKEGFEVSELSALIYEITTKSGQGPEILTDRVSLADLPDNSPLSYLLNSETLASYGNKYNITNREEWVLAFRTTQVELLSRMIARTPLDLVSRTLLQFRNLSKFIRTEGDLKKEDENWYRDKIILEHKDWLIQNLIAIIKQLREDATINNVFSVEKARELVSGIFHDITWDIYQREDFVKLIDFNRGYETLMSRGFTFNDQRPLSPEFPQFNDHIYPEIFKWEIGDRFEILIKPGCDFWRIGFRLSSSKEFEEIIKERHTTSHPYIVLTKGVFPEGGTTKDEPDDELEIVAYAGVNITRQINMIGADDRKEMTFAVEKIAINRFDTDIDTAVAATIEGSRIDMPADFPYVQIIAWADERPFQLNTFIKILRLIN